MEEESRGLPADTHARPPQLCLPMAAAQRFSPWPRLPWRGIEATLPRVGHPAQSQPRDHRSPPQQHSRVKMGMASQSLNPHMREAPSLCLWPHANPALPLPPSDPDRGLREGSIGRGEGTELCAGLRAKQV